MHQGHVENRHWHIGLVKQHAYFRTSENQAVGATVDKTLGDGNIGRLAFLVDDAAAKFFVNDPVRFGAIRCVRDNWIEASRGQSPGVEGLLHCESGSHEAWRPSCDRKSVV